jgi:hypothetical protein
LGRATARYAEKVKWYDALLAKLADARKQAETGQPLGENFFTLQPR